MKYTPPPSTPDGPAGGMLAGTYPNPSINSTSIPSFNYINLNEGTGIGGMINFGNPLNNCYVLAQSSGQFQFLTPIQTSGQTEYAFFDASEILPVVAIVSQGSGYGGIKTAPLNYATNTIALNTQWANTHAWDVTIMIVLGITANTSLVISAGINQGAPVMQTILSGTTLTGIVPLVFRVPQGYTFELATSGTGTVSIIGQMLMNS